MKGIGTVATALEPAAAQFTRSRAAPSCHRVRRRREHLAGALAGAGAPQCADDRCDGSTWLERSMRLMVTAADPWPQLAVVVLWAMAVESHR